MAKDISLLGAIFRDVPAVELPIDGGGTARFVDEDEAGGVDGDELAYGAAIVGTAVVGSATI